MEIVGINTSDMAFILKQTGTHAQPGNPGWNSMKSDFDHTFNFSDAKYNNLYEQQLNTHLEAQGTSAKALDVNVYGEGTSSQGAYKGGAMKFVEHYNETTGSDIMVRNVNGATHITYETPQTSTSLLGKMNQGDVASAHTNYQNFFQKDISKAGDLNSQVVNGAKTISRDAGKNGIQSVNNYLQTGKVNYQPPPAAQVADRIKNLGETPQHAMKKVG
jgi:hypothetical protein